MEGAAMTDQYHVGDRIEHVLLPGFAMSVLDARESEEPDHLAYQVIDPESAEDWLCAHDVRAAS